MKIELEFDVTKIGDDSVEGTWWPATGGERGMMTEFITRHVTTDDAIMEKWGIDSPFAHERMTKNFSVSLYTEDGRFFSGGEVSSGVFTAWRD